MRYAGFLVLIAAVVQYALGATMLLTGPIPPTLSAHITLGFLLAAGAVVFLVVAIRGGPAASIVLGGTSLLAIAAAVGTSFAFLRSERSAYVVDMALLADVAALAYASAQFSLAGAARRPSSAQDPNVGRAPGWPT